MSSRPVLLVVALPAEARPLIRAFEMQRLPATEAPIYRRRNLRLIISGVGRRQAWLAVHHLRNCLPPGEDCRPPIWLNIGIAGHATEKIGTALLARQLADATTGESWSLRIPPGAPCAADTLTTLDAPDNTYPHSGMIDMEASGFFTAVCEIGNPAHVLCLKIVSDNPQQTSKGINGRFVRGLISDKLDLIRALIVLIANDKG